MVKKILCIISCVCMGIMSSSPAWSQTLIRVYVQAGSGDFAANGAGDSSLDVRKALLGKSRTLRVVESEADADLLLRIDSRSVRKETAAVNTYANQSKDGKSGTATTVPTVRNIDVLHATIVAGNSQIPLETESALSWRLAAGDMASSVDHWVKENYAKLIERRSREPRGPRATEPLTDSRSAASPVGSASEDASITPGMTEQDVLEAMGTPEKKVAFGKRSLWNYRGLQVVFEDGKVTNVKF